MSASWHGPIERAVRRNPVWLREWRASSRLAGTPWLIALSSLAMTVLLGLLAMKQRDRLAIEIGQNLFQVYFGLSALLVTLVGPAIAANSIALEREGKTWDALLMAGVKPRTIDRGKFFGAYTQLALVIFALAPVAALPMLYGGVSHLEIALGFVLVFVLGAIAVRFGLAVSAALPSTRMALLVTVVAAAMLCVGLTTLGVGGTKWLSRHGGMSGLSYDTVVFWPIALARASLDFDYLRYLVLAPLTFASLAWVVLRELTVASLTTPPDDPHRALRITFAVAAPMLAIALGLLPHDDWGQVFGAESLFALFVFGAIIVLGAVRTPAHALSGVSAATLANAHLKTSLLVGVAGVGGMVIVSMLGDALGALHAKDFADETTAVQGMRLYAPAFAVFLVGAAAYARAHLPSTKARVLVLATPFVVMVLAAVLSMGLTFANDGRRVDWPIAMTPLAVLDEVHTARITLAASAWSTLGAGLLALAYLRDRRVRWPHSAP